MTESTKSSVRVNTKPVNVFYVWYSELCRRLNSSPAPLVRPTKNKCKTVLDFVADRLKLEEWSPVINALRHDTSLHVINIRSRIGNCQFLHDIDTEEKARKLKRKYGTLWTAYILKNLLRSISCSVKNSQVLTCLELDGLPMFSQYLEPLLQALKKNNTVKSLSLANCAMKDGGCELVCGYLRFTPNVEIINLSGCGLTSVSGTHIAKLIKFQQINRYCESWHRSLRYENPDSNIMRGIKRITLNRNPLIHDEGLSYILKELEDDLWIKALDMQKCGITDQIADSIIELLEYSKSLEIIDLRQNEGVHAQTIDKILQLLKEKQLNGSEPEYQWCDTAITLSFNSIGSSSDISCYDNHIQKSTSLPVRNTGSGLSYDKSIQRSRTTGNVRERKIVPSLTNSGRNVGDAKNQILKLSSQLEREVSKRKAAQKKNLELKKCLEECKSVSSIQCTSSRGNFKTIISAIEKLKPIANSVPMLKHVEENSSNDKSECPKKPVKNPQRSIFTSASNMVMKNDKVKNGMKNLNTAKSVIKKDFDKGDMVKQQEFIKSTAKNDTYKTGDTIDQKNGFHKGNTYKNGDNGALKYGQNGFVYQNGYHNASNLFEQFIKSSTIIDEVVDEDEEFLKLLKTSDIGQSNNFNELSSSQTSLFNFIEELKASNLSKDKHRTSTNHPK